MTIRIDYPPEPITFVAHAGACRYCDGTVKMRRDYELRLKPDQCFCLKCGQRYYVTVTGSLEEFDKEQWRQKARRK